MQGHLVGFESIADEEDRFGEVRFISDGGVAYDREVEKRQSKRLPARCRPEPEPKESSDEFTEALLDSFDPKRIRSEHRDKTAEKIREAKTHAEKMQIAQKYHESLLVRDPYVFSKGAYARLLAENRTALKFERVHE